MFIIYLMSYHEEFGPVEVDDEAIYESENPDRILDDIERQEDERGIVRGIDEFECDYVVNENGMGGDVNYTCRVRSTKLKIDRHGAVPPGSWRNVLPLILDP